MSSILAIFLVWAIFSAIANERSREVGIMRAVGAKESHIVKLFMLEVFLVELTGSLKRMAAMELFKKLNRGKKITFIFITHSLELARQAGRQLRMSSGKLTVLKAEAPLHHSSIKHQS